ncbi:MAG: hypothetical protein A2V63_10730 [Candidatus Eisenbacteria bacterium RBG_19FT_COMBO_70_11]|nr:MAG: hypothetical protein A2V63_10730 [Candidatus Eisenbacteria bacterium RBG_19FT_COMBO_70_11]
MTSQVSPTTTTKAATASHEGTLSATTIASSSRRTARGDRLPGAMPRTAATSRSTSPVRFASVSSDSSRYFPAKPSARHAKHTSRASIRASRSRRMRSSRSKKSWPAV